MPLLVNQKRFEGVRVTEWWKDGGYGYVRGYVPGETDLRDLRRIVLSTDPPAPVAWAVEVTATDREQNGLSK